MSTKYLPETYSPAKVTPRDLNSHRDVMIDSIMTSLEDRIYQGDKIYQTVLEDFTRLLWLVQNNKRNDFNIWGELSELERRHNLCYVSIEDQFVRAEMHRNGIYYKLAKITQELKIDVLRFADKAHIKFVAENRLNWAITSPKYVSDSDGFLLKNGAYSQTCEKARQDLRDVQTKWKVLAVRWIEEQKTRLNKALTANYQVT